MHCQLRVNIRGRRNIVYSCVELHPKLLLAIAVFVSAFEIDLSKNADYFGEKHERVNKV